MLSNLVPSQEEQVFSETAGQGGGRYRLWLVRSRHHLDTRLLRLCPHLPSPPSPHFSNPIRPALRTPRELVLFRFPLPQTESLGIPDRRSQLRTVGETEGREREGEGEGRDGGAAPSLAIKASIVRKELTCIPGLQLARNNGV